jgi:glycosyltransferase involved in cell wall biosynthesis
MSTPNQTRVGGDAQQTSPPDLVELELRAAAPGPYGRIQSQDYNRVRTLVERVRGVSQLAATLDELLPLVRRHPENERLQRLVALALGRTQDSRAVGVWRGIDRRFPDSDTAPIHVARNLVRARGIEAAETYIKQRFAEPGDEPDRKLLLARTYLEVGNSSGAGELFNQIIDDARSDEAVLVRVAELLIRQGMLSDAETTAELVISKFGDTPKHKALLDQIDRTREITHEQSAGEVATANVVAAVIRKALRFAEENQSLSFGRGVPGSLGPVVMINGGLGPGGAERQIVTTALRLQEAAMSGRRIGGVDVLGPPTLICRSVSSREGADFFLAQLREAGIKVHEYSTFEPFGGRAKRSLSRHIGRLLGHVPYQMRDGIVQLTDALRYLDPEVAHIWQDGSILATGVAALLAGVPRIILGVRTMPPVDRRDRDKPEYLPIFQGLLARPGVTLVSNSRLVAARYAQWLDLDLDTIRVIPNGVAPANAEPTSHSLELARTMAPPTGEDFVVGSVMRFDENKRPMLWIDSAAAIAVKHPRARFIMVGAGPLRDVAIERVHSLGLGERFTFTGATPDVGFWLSKMDVFLLLSKFEGLPNVLIEAQMSGVPVVTTPAGGAAEAVAPGGTGTVLPSVDGADPDSIADAVLSWKRGRLSRSELAESVKNWATSHFSIDRMVERTVQTYTEGRGSPRFNCLI